MLGIAVDAGQPQRGGGPQRIHREDRFLVPFFGMGQQLVGREAARHVLDGDLFLGQLEVHARPRSIFGRALRRESSRSHGRNQSPCRCVKLGRQGELSCPPTAA